MKRKMLGEEEIQLSYLASLKEDAEAEQETGMPLFHGSLPNVTTDRVTNGELMAMLARRAKSAPEVPQFGVLTRDILK